MLSSLFNIAVVAKNMKLFVDKLFDQKYVGI